MTRRNRGIVGVMNERDFPHLVELALPPGGFRSVVLEIDAFHRERRIPVLRGQSRHEVKQFYIRFCFPDTATADEFRNRFGGECLTHARAVKRDSERSVMAVRLPLPRKKAPNPTDQHVGSRVRMRRMMLAMSQKKLGDALGLTFQQVQKYVKGANRIGVSRLQQISHILQVPIEFFFEGAPNALAPHGSGSALSIAQIDDFVSDSDGLRLIRAFMRIDNATLRRRITMLVQEIAGDDD